MIDFAISMIFHIIAGFISGVFCAIIWNIGRKLIEPCEHCRDRIARQKREWAEHQRACAANEKMTRRVRAKAEADFQAL